MALDYSHCLRKSFTHFIHQELIKGESINLVGAKFTGRQRLLEDLSLLALQEGYTPIVVDMNAYKNHFTGFVEEVQEQMSKAFQLVSTLETADAHPELPEGSTALPMKVEHFSRALTTYLPQHKRIILMLNNFDSLLDNPKQRFPKTFFDDLNSLRHKPNLSLLAVTLQSHLKSYIHYKAEDGEEIKSTLSWLDLVVVDMMKPTLGEIREELGKRLDEYSTWRNEPEKERFVEAVQDHTAFYQFMVIVCNSFKLNLNQETAELRLKRCYSQFGNNFNRPEESHWPKILDTGKTFIEWATDQVAKIAKAFGK